MPRHAPREVSLRSASLRHASSGPVMPLPENAGSKPRYRRHVLDHAQECSPL